MPLEIKVYPDVHAYEAKAMFGLKWRQLGALVVGGTLTVVVFFAVTITYLVISGFEYTGMVDLLDPPAVDQALIDSGSTIGMGAAFLTFMPFAVFGWLRPKGLKPEKYIPYWWTYITTPKELCYGRDDAGDAAQPVGDRGRNAVHDRRSARGRRGSRDQRVTKKVVRAVEQAPARASKRRTQKARHY